MLSILFIYFNHYHNSKTLGLSILQAQKYTSSHQSMQPNVKFRVDLPKTNLGLAKSHLQKHVATHKKQPQTAIVESSFCNLIPLDHTAISFYSSSHSHQLDLSIMIFADCCFSIFLSTLFPIALSAFFSLSVHFAFAFALQSLLVY